MVCSVSEPGRAFAESQGSLMPRPPSNSESDRRVARGLATRRHKVNHRQVGRQDYKQREWDDRAQQSSGNYPVNTKPHHPQP
jgi:hypothetical protein